MEITTLCPFAVGTVIWQGQGGAWTLTTCVKGTFKLVHGRDALIADEQEGIGADRYYAGTGASLYAPSDIIPYKPRTDVIVVGHAYAPGGKPVDALVARFTIGDLTKAIGIIGDRVWTEGPYGLEPSTPAPFTKMPLRYERAARGPGNPVGVDLAAPPVAGARALPNLEAVDDDAGIDASVGFGPIAPSWSLRKGLLHPASIAWVAEGARGPVPEGFDFGFYNVAPHDQQISLLRQSAKIVLENLNQDHARLETRLPNIRPKAFLIDRFTGRGNEIALRCDSVLIDADRAIAVVTWRGLTGVETGDVGALGTLAVAAEMKGKELRWKHVERLLREEGLTSADTESFTMSDVNPLNVRYDGVTLAQVPEATTELPTTAIGEARSSRLPSPPEMIVAEQTTQRLDVDQERFRAAAAGAPALHERGAATGVEEQVETTVTEIPTVQMKVQRQLLSSVGGAAARKGQPADSVPDADTSEMPKLPAIVPPSAAEGGANRTAPIPRPTTARPPPPAIPRATPVPPPPIVPRATPVPPPPLVPRATPVPPPPVVSRATPPAPQAISMNPDEVPSLTEVLPMSLPPAIAMPTFGNHATAPRSPSGSVPPPAPVPPGLFAHPPPPPPPAHEPPKARRSVGLADYARIEIAVERGDAARVLASMQLNASELERIRAEWIDRIRNEPAIAAVYEEALEAARGE